MRKKFSLMRRKATKQISLSKNIMNYTLHKIMILIVITTALVTYSIPSHALHIYVYSSNSFFSDVQSSQPNPLWATDGFYMFWGADISDPTELSGEGSWMYLALQSIPENAYIDSFAQLDGLIMWIGEYQFYKGTYLEGTGIDAVTFNLGIELFIEDEFTGHEYLLDNLIFDPFTITIDESTDELILGFPEELPSESFTVNEREYLMTMVALDYVKIEAVKPVPEPATILLIGSGLLGLLGLRRKLKK